MLNFRWKMLAGFLMVAGAAATLSAQGITTGAIGGTVMDPAGKPVGNVQVQVVNRSNGFTTGATTRDNGKYYVQGLEIGSTYQVTIRRIGFAPQRQENIAVGLSQTTTLDFKLEQQATQLVAISITANQLGFEASNTGTKAAVNDTILQRLPTENRQLTDFIKLVPQVSTSGAGYSVGAMSNRMNNVQIDGATERDVFGLGATGQPGGQVSAKSISIEGVKEFQVLLAPFDVRQGNFGGLLLNAVTKSGTNNWHGSLFGDYRNQDYGRNTPVLRSTAFDRTQYGFSIGGPIIKDKLTFFAVMEKKTENAPLSGPYLGQPSNSTSPLQVAAADLTRYEQIIAGAPYNHTDFGSAGYLNSPKPQFNPTVRLDWSINDANRLVFRYNYGEAEIAMRTQNGRSSSTMVYSDNEHDLKDTKQAPVLQLFTNFKDGSSNELFLGANYVKDRRVPNTTFPMMTVFSLNRVGGGAATIIGGADQFSQVNELDVDTYELTDNYTKNFGSHTLTFGTRNEYVKLRNLFLQSSFGVWGFRNLDSLAAGNANSFRKAIILQNGGNAIFKSLQSAWYAQDQWSVTPRFSMTMGVRADVSQFLTDIPYNASIDSAYGRRTDNIPKTTVQWSPRVGFNWDVTGDQWNQVRGGVGLFVGTPPYVWLENSVVNSGNIITFLNCNTSGSTDPSPAWAQDITTINTCANGKGAKPIGESDFMQKDLKFPQPLRFTLAYDRRLSRNWVGTIEGMYGRTLNQLFMTNLNLKGVRGVDPHGRVLFGDSILTATGADRPSIPTAILANGGTSRFAAAFDMTNQSNDYFYNMTLSVARRYFDNWQMYAAYTYGRSYDVQSFSSSTAVSNWQFGRTLSSDQFAADVGISGFDQPHNVIVTATYTAHWWEKKLATDFTVFYRGSSGSPHDYIYGGAGGAGDLNDDGRQGNDLVYVPKSALDPTEIQFRASGAITAATQAQAFEDFINSSPCLSKYRGQILRRNSCRVPWQEEMNLTIRQELPEMFGGQRASFSLELYNVMNMINSDWGKSKQTDGTTNSNVPLLTAVGSSNIDPKIAVPIVQFNTALKTYIKGNSPFDNWRIQGGFRYAF